MSNLKRFLAMTLVVVMMIGALATTVSAKTFGDVNDTKRVDLINAIDVLSELGIIRGYEDGDFGVDDTVERQQMAMFIARIKTASPEFFVDKASKLEAAFTDCIDATFWSAIDYCFENYIIDGRGEGIFDPTAEVTLQEAIKMLVSALGYTGLQYPIGYLTQAKEIGLLNGFELNKISANDSLTRGEVAALLYNYFLSDYVELKVVYNPVSGNSNTMQVATPVCSKFGITKIEGYVTAVQDFAVNLVVDLQQKDNFRMSNNAYLYDNRYFEMTATAIPKRDVGSVANARDTMISWIEPEYVYSSTGVITSVKAVQKNYHVLREDLGIGSEFAGVQGGLDLLGRKVVAYVNTTSTKVVLPKPEIIGTKTDITDTATYASNKLSTGLKEGKTSFDVTSNSNNTEIDSAINIYSFNMKGENNNTKTYGGSYGSSSYDWKTNDVGGYIYEENYAPASTMMTLGYSYNLPASWEDFRDYKWDKDKKEGSGVATIRRGNTRYQFPSRDEFARMVENKNKTADAVQSYQLLYVDNSAEQNGGEYLFIFIPYRAGYYRDDVDSNTNRRFGFVDNGEKEKVSIADKALVTSTDVSKSASLSKDKAYLYTVAGDYLFVHTELLRYESTISNVVSNVYGRKVVFSRDYANSTYNQYAPYYGALEVDYTNAMLSKSYNFISDHWDKGDAASRLGFKAGESYALFTLNGEVIFAYRTAEAKSDTARQYGVAMDSPSITWIGTVQYKTLYVYNAGAYGSSSAPGYETLFFSTSTDLGNIVKGSQIVFTKTTTNFTSGYALTTINGFHNPQVTTNTATLSNTSTNNMLLSGEGGSAIGIDAGVWSNAAGTPDKIGYNSASNKIATDNGNNGNDTATVSPSTVFVIMGALTTTSAVTGTIANNSTGTGVSLGVNRLTYDQFKSFSADMSNLTASVVSATMITSSSSVNAAATVVWLVLNSADTATGSGTVNFASSTKATYHAGLVDYLKTSTSATAKRYATVIETKGYGMGMTYAARQYKGIAVYDYAQGKVIKVYGLTSGADRPLAGHVVELETVSNTTAGTVDVATVVYPTNRIDNDKTDSDSVITESAIKAACNDSNLVTNVSANGTITVGGTTYPIKTNIRLSVIEKDDKYKFHADDVTDMGDEKYGWSMTTLISQFNNRKADADPTKHYDLYAVVYADIYNNIQTITFIKGKTATASATVTAQAELDNIVSELKNGVTVTNKAGLTTPAASGSVRHAIITAIDAMSTSFDSANYAITELTITALAIGGFVPSTNPGTATDATTGDVTVKITVTSKTDSADTATQTIIITVTVS